MQHSKEFIDLVNAARKNIQECTINDVKQRLDSEQPFLLIDVREASEFAKSYIPGAVHLSRGVLEVKVIQTIPDKTAEIVLYCGGGYRSALSAENLVKMGYKKVISMDGGFRAWCEAGYPVVMGQ